MPKVDALVTEGMVTLEKVQVHVYRGREPEG